MSLQKKTLHVSHKVTAIAVQIDFVALFTIVLFTNDNVLFHSEGNILKQEIIQIQTEKNNNC